MPRYRSGYEVITICGSQNYARLKAAGADHCFDYLDPEVGHKVRDLTQNTLRFAWDTIASETTAKICADALSSKFSCRYGGVNPVKFPRSNVGASSIVMYTMFNEPFTFGAQEFAASIEDFQFAEKFMVLTEELLAKVRLPQCLLDSNIDGPLAQTQDTPRSFAGWWSRQSPRGPDRAARWEGGIWETSIRSYINVVLMQYCSGHT